MARFSANLVFLFADAPFIDRFERAAAAGFRSVEYMFPYPYDPADLRARLDVHGLEQDLFNLPAGDFEAGDRGMATDPDRRDEFARGVDDALRYAEALGTRKLNCLVGKRRNDLPFETQYGCLVENLGAAAERLGSEGRTLHVELLNPVETPGFFLGDLGVVERLLADVGSPHLRFQADLYHLQRTHGELTPTLRRLAPLIGHVQIADVPERHEPGTGELNYRWLLKVVDEIGYAGRIGLEYKPSARTEETLGWIEAYGYRRD